MGTSYVWHATHHRSKVASKPVIYFRYGSWMNRSVIPRLHFERQQSKHFYYRLTITAAGLPLQQSLATYRWYK